MPAMKQGIVSTVRRKVRIRTRLRRIFSAERRVAALTRASRRVAASDEEILRVLKYRNYVSPRAESRIVDAFHQLYYDSKTFGQTWAVTFWLDTPVQKCPLDLWIYQEIIHELKPGLIIETGTAAGGSALFMASICDILGRGRVVSIDVVPQADRPTHPRVTYLTGSSTSSIILDQVRALAAVETSVMVILDSDHSKEHVLRELELYSDLVTQGSYLVVEDTNVNGHPVYPTHGPGPMEALEAFLETDRRFATDSSREKLLLTFNPRGYLRRQQ